MMVAISALSATALASKVTLPLAMAATRPKWADITVKAARRYLIASSGLANCAAAGNETARLARPAATISTGMNDRVMDISLSRTRGAASPRGGRVYAGHRRIHRGLG